MLGTLAVVALAVIGAVVRRFWPKAAARVLDVDRRAREAARDFAVLRTLLHGGVEDATAAWALSEATARAQMTLIQIRDLHGAVGKPLPSWYDSASSTVDEAVRVLTVASRRIGG